MDQSQGELINPIVVTVENNVILHQNDELGMDIVPDAAAHNFSVPSWPNMR